MLKDLGTRPIELTWLKAHDIDLSIGIASITGAKHTIGGEEKLKAKTIDLLKINIEKKNLSPNSTLFKIKSENMANDYRHYRKRLVKDYNIPVFIRQQ